MLTFPRNLGINSLREKDYDSYILLAHITNKLLKNMVQIKLIIFSGGDPVDNHRFYHTAECVVVLHVAALLEQASK